METIEWEDFDKIHILAGTIVDVQEFPQAKKPAYKLEIDLGEKIGVKKSSAQITTFYTKEALLGKQVLCVVNFKPRQIGPFLSEVLTTGFHQKGGVVLATTEKKVTNGTRLF